MRSAISTSSKGTPTWAMPSTSPRMETVNNQCGYRSGRPHGRPLRLVPFAWNNSADDERDAEETRRAHARVAAPSVALGIAGGADDCGAAGARGDRPRGVTGVADE